MVIKTKVPLLTDGASTVAAVVYADTHPYGAYDAGDEIASFTSGAFGDNATITGTTENNIWYKGYQYDTETGDYYCWNRYYNPNTAAWQQSDPVQNINLYKYVSSKPILLSDSTGMIEWTSVTPNFKGIGKKGTGKTKCTTINHGKAFSWVCTGGKITAQGGTNEGIILTCQINCECRVKCGRTYTVVNKATVSLITPSLQKGTIPKADQECCNTGKGTASESAGKAATARIRGGKVFNDINLFDF